MGVINWNQEFDINIYSIWHEALGFLSTDDFCDDAYSNLLSEIKSVVTNVKYKENVHFIEYNANQHFYFVEKFENWIRKNSKIRDSFELGYFCQIHKFNPTEQEKWAEEIIKVLNNRGKEKNQFYTELKSSKSILEDKVQEAFKGTYDIFSYQDSRIILRYNTDDLEEKKSFSFFFTWVMALIEYEFIDDFLDYHFTLNFNRDWNTFARFLDLLLSKNEDGVLNESRLKIIRKYLDSANYQVVVMKDYKEGEVSLINETNKKKVGRPPKEKIEIPTPPERKANDKQTIFNKAETALFFSYLAQLNIVLNDDNGISQESFIKTVQCMTGFSAGKLKGVLIYEGDVKPKTIEQKKRLVEDMKSLIIKKL